MHPKSDSVKSRIDACETTSDTLTGRAGLSLVSRYIEATGITAILARRFAFLRRSRKGLPLETLFHQIICFFFDGTDLHLTRFDHLQDEPGYVGKPGVQGVWDRTSSLQAVCF